MQKKIDKAAEILAKARELDRACSTWADLSNALFDPMQGEVARMFPDPSARAVFRRTDAYEQLHTLVERKADATGLVAGATPKKSGKFVVRLPRSLHAALEREAAGEGTSLNQLVVAKLAVQLDSVMSGSLANVVRAFVEVRNGSSTDRVIADPELNRKFLRRCRELGLSGTDYDLNWTLMNARKAGTLSNLPKTKRYTIKGRDEFEYASELAVRYLQRRDDVSIDQIICDPDLAHELDEYAARLAPGFLPIEYRWCALGLRKAGLRKAGRLKSPASRVIGQIPPLVSVGSVNKLRIESMPEEAGLYLFSSKDKPVFMSQTENLRHRIERHMTVSASRGLPAWLWEEKGPLSMSLATMPDVSRTLRQATEMVLVGRLRPLLNFERNVA